VLGDGEQLDPATEISAASCDTYAHGLTIGAYASFLMVSWSMRT